MLNSSDIFADCKYLYLERLFEPSENEITIRLLEAVDGGTVPVELNSNKEVTPLLDAFRNSTAIEHRAGCRIFEITWPSYIGYAVRNESFATLEPEKPVNAGRLFCEYAASNYLTYLAESSWACADFPGVYKHWAAYCLNHVVDVASVNEPNIVVSISSVSTPFHAMNFSMSARGK